METITTTVYGVGIVLIALAVISPFSFLYAYGKNHDKLWAKVLAMGLLLLFSGYMVGKTAF